MAVMNAMLRCPVVRKSHVGASLLAKAECQPASILGLEAPARAGSLPQVSCRSIRQKQKRSVRTLRSLLKSILLADLLFLDLRQCLAVDAQVGGRACFKTLDADLDAAGLTPAVLFVFDQLKRLVDLLDQLALTIAGSKLESELFFLAGTVCRVREVGRFVLHVVHSLVDTFHQLFFPLIQNLGEVFAHGLAHVLFASFLNIGLEAADRLIRLLLCLGGHEIDRLYSCNPSAQDCSITGTCRPCGCKRANLSHQIRPRYSRMARPRPAAPSNDGEAVPGG